MLKSISKSLIRIYFKIPRDVRIFAGDWTMRRIFRKMSFLERRYQRLGAEMTMFALVGHDKRCYYGIALFLRAFMKTYLFGIQDDHERKVRIEKITIVMVFLVCCAIRQNGKEIIRQFDPHAGYSVQKVATFLNGGPYFRPTGLSTAQLLRWYGRCYVKAIQRNARIIPMVGIIAFPRLYANSNFCFKDALIQYGEFVWRFGSYVVIGMQNQVMMTDIVASIFGYVPTTIEYGILGIVGASAIEIVPTDRIISYNSWGLAIVFENLMKKHMGTFSREILFPLMMLTVFQIENEMQQNIVRSVDALPRFEIENRVNDIYEMLWISEPSDDI